MSAYRQGLHELGNSLYAYLQPDGGWGWSNAGLVCDGEHSLLDRHPVRPPADRADAALTCGARCRRRPASTRS